MVYDRNKVVTIMRSWMGAVKGSNTHKHIIDTYNKITPLPAGYKVTYKDNWCAATYSAAFKEAGYSAICPSECSCSRMINKAKALGIWVENDAYIPKPGDGLIYDWQDKGVGDCTGAPDHIGMVLSVNNNKMVIGEGNMSTRSVVGTRTMAINSRYIRGFVVPKFDNTAPICRHPVIKQGDKGHDVVVLHQRLFALCYDVSKTDDVFGTHTTQCVLHFQAVNALPLTGIVDEATWLKLGV